MSQTSGSGPSVLSLPPLNPHQKKFLEKVSNSFLFSLFLFTKLPAAWLAGCRVRTLTEEVCEIDVPFKWLTQNPFRSTYFASLSMAAEMSTGLPAMIAVQGFVPPISMLVVGLEATFTKKATGVTTFTCKDFPALRQLVEKARISGEAHSFRSESIGRNEAGEEVARFYITWSFKAKSS